MCSLHIPESFGKLEKGAPALSASIACQGSASFLCIYSSSFFLYLRYKLTPIAIPAAAMIITTYTAGR